MVYCIFSRSAPFVIAFLSHIAFFCTFIYYILRQIIFLLL
jgi:hypothetical protein